MARHFFDHTGDVGVRLTGESLVALFRDAALAFTETITDLSSVGAMSPHSIQIASPTLDDLLVDWLDELLYRFEARNLLVADVDVSIDRERHGTLGWRLEGTVQGEAFDPERHPIKVLIKGITYHQLHVRRAGNQWETSVVFDI